MKECLVGPVLHFGGDLVPVDLAQVEHGHRPRPDHPLAGLVGLRSPKAQGLPFLQVYRRSAAYILDAVELETTGALFEGLELQEDEFLLRVELSGRGLAVREGRAYDALSLARLEDAARLLHLLVDEVAEVLGVAVVRDVADVDPAELMRSEAERLTARVCRGVGGEAGPPSPLRTCSGTTAAAESVGSSDCYFQGRVRRSGRSH